MFGYWKKNFPSPRHKLSNLPFIIIRKQQLLSKFKILTYLTHYNKFKVWKQQVYFNCAQWKLSLFKKIIHSHMGKQNNIITREKLILAMWCMEQKVILFRCRIDIRDEQARPSPARPGHDALWRIISQSFQRI